MGHDKATPARLNVMAAHPMKSATVVTTSK